MATGTSSDDGGRVHGSADSFDGPTELVKGVLVTMPPARPRHGQICVTFRLSPRNDFWKTMTIGTWSAMIRAW